MGLRASTIDLLIDALGEDAAERMIAHFGGRRLYIPVRLLARTHLAEILGIAAGERLCARFGGECLNVPLRFHGESLGPRIIELAGGGLAPADIARDLGCSERHVFRVLARSRASC